MKHVFTQVIIINSFCHCSSLVELYQCNQLLIVNILFQQTWHAVCCPSSGPSTFLLAKFSRRHTPCHLTDMRYTKITLYHLGNTVCVLCLSVVLFFVSYEVPLCFTNTI